MPGPEIQVVVEMLRANPPIAGDDVLEMRAAMEATAGAAPLPEDVSFEAVDAGGVPAEWTTAAGASAERAATASARASASLSGRLPLGSAAAGPPPPDRPRLLRAGPASTTWAASVSRARPWPK